MSGLISGCIYKIYPLFHVLIEVFQLLFASHLVCIASCMCVFA